MTKDKKIKSDTPLKHENHNLKSRRDFLAQGFLTGVGFTLVPSLLSTLYSNAANALECGVATQQMSRVPVIIFDLSGGANLIGSNVMVGKAGGQQDYLANYETLGLPADMHPKKSGQTNSEMGLMFHNDSAILRGIQGTTAATTRAKVEGGVFCAASNDDTQNNPHNPMYWLAKAGVTGDLTPMAGTSNSPSGGNSIAPQSSLIATLKPVILNTPQDALGLVNIGKLGTLYGADKAQKVLKSIENLSAQKMKQLSSKALPEQIKDLVNCGYIQSQDLLNRFSATAVDPAQDALVKQVFPQMATNNEQKKTATMAKLVLDGFVGVGTIEIGGFDYHDGTRATGETNDFEAGTMIGKVLELAALKKKDILIYVYTDGGVSAGGSIDNTADGRGKLTWSGDSSLRSSSFMLLYQNAGKPTLRNANMRQIGSFNDKGAVNTTASLTSNSVTNLSKALVANYLSLTGKESTLESVVGDNPFGSNINNYLFFNKI